MVTQADTDHIMKFPILVGDIGGTNARFAILVDAYAEPKEFPDHPDGGFSDHRRGDPERHSRPYIHSAAFGRYWP